jgi:LmbE family N-acetylglucosaminyl deacetylase
MIGRAFDRGPNAPYRILLLGAHADDLEIGCGGTVLRLLEAYPNAVVRWIVLSGSPERAAEARAAAGLFLADARDPEIMTASFEDGFFPYHGAELKRFFEREVKPFAPDLVLTHYRDDRHQDHRVVSDLTWNTFRSHLILEYEILKYDGDLGAPNLFVNLPEAVCERKVSYLLDAFPSQRAKHWFTADTFRAMLRIRGVESAAGPFAEAFYGRKLVW